MTHAPLHASIGGARVHASGRTALLLLLVGCKGCKEADTPPTDLTEVGRDPVGVYVGEGMGAGSASVPVYAINTLGAAVPATDLTADGTLTVDAAGWGTVVVETSTSVSASSAGTTAQGAGWVTNAAPPSFELPGYALNGLVPPEHVAVAGNGAAWVSAGTVWWASSTQPAVPVAVLPDDAGMVVAVQLDEDGVTDLLTWGRTGVALLRGRDGGGLTWGAGWTTTNAIVGCDVQDLDGDGLPDLQVAVTDGVATNVLWMLNTGDGWELGDWLALDFVALGVAGEDYTSDDLVEISAIGEDGMLRRYTRYEEGWSPGSSNNLQFDITAGARMYPSTDLDDDGIKEIVAAGPLADGTGWQAIAVTAGADTTRIYNFYSSESASGLPTDIELAIGDLTGDGLADLALTSDLGLGRIAWNTTAETAGFQSLTTEGFPTGRGVGVGEATGDDVQDVLLGSEDYVLAVQGVREEDDPTTPLMESWTITPSSFLGFNLLIAGIPVMEDLDGDGQLDLLSFTQSDSGLELQTWRSYPATTDAAAGWAKSGALLLSSAADPIDVAVCGEVAWALYTESGTTWLRAYLLSDSGVAGTLQASASVTGQGLLCGPFDDVAGSAVAVVDTTGATLVTANGATSSVSLPGASVTSADTDGDGLRELVGNDSPGQLLAWDFDGDGAEEVVASFDDSIGITDLRPGSGGDLSLRDADGDGVADVVVQKDGTVWLYRVIDGELTPPAVFHTTRPVGGPAWFSDVSGDGKPDLLMLGAADDPQWAGALLFSLTTP